jgi:hypothetical protein
LPKPFGWGETNAWSFTNHVSVADCSDVHMELGGPSGFQSGVSLSGCRQPVPRCTMVHDGRQHTVQPPFEVRPLNTVIQARPASAAM